MNNLTNWDEATEPVAIIGIGCRFPGGVSSPEAFWKLLLNEVDAISEIPSSRFDIDALFDPRPATPGRIMTRWGGFLENIDQFDASFFGISPREADRLDPQQRLVLEVAWEALEDAGEPIGTPKILNGGVFVGCWLNDYENRLFRDPDQIDFYMTTGSGRYSVAGRLSYFLGMQGPSITVDTACSSSLVSVHLACQSLRSRECALALAGGTNVILQPGISIAYSQSRMMAPDGRCKFGDARGNGYVRSEGAAIIALKRLSDAIADKNPIYAVIRGSAVNNDGRSSGFLTTPGGAGQEDMLRKAYQNAKVSPGQIQYIEAHGTGTRAGDPVEIQALGAVLKKDRPAGQICKIGSVKTNFGHTEGAAGVAGLIKVALSLKNRYIPASLHFQEPNPNIPWNDMPLQIQSKGGAWPEHEGPAIAGVSAFGIAGTNAHIVLQEAPDLNPPITNLQSADGSLYLIPLSARSPSALRDHVQHLKSYIQDHETFTLYDLGYSAGTRHTHHDYRTSFVAGSLQGLDEQISLFLQDWLEESFPQVELAGRKILFIFPGQGSQWIGMGIQLMEKEPVFRGALERCSRAMEPLTGWSLIETLGSPRVKERIEQIDFIQPALFAMQVALAEQWRSWGVNPDAVAGHSMGEVAAAYIAGAISLEDAVRIICNRSQLMKTVSGKGAMISVDLSLEDSRVLIAGYEEKISIAVSNSPRSTVLSGDPTAIEEVSDTLKNRNILFRQVKVDVAAHSPQMEPLRPLLEQSLAGLKSHPNTTPIYSTVTAKLEDGLNFDISYWGSNLRQPVLFSSVLKQALDEGFNTFIEISPHPVLLAAVVQACKIFKPDSNVTFATLPSARRNEDEQAVLMQSLGKLYELGCPIDWSLIYPREGALVKLPSYPWQREHFWLEIENPLAGSTIGARSGKNPLSGYPVISADSPSVYIREIHLNKKNYPEAFALYIHGINVLPHSACIEIAYSALIELMGPGPIELSNVHFEHAIQLNGAQSKILQIILTPFEREGFSFRIICQEGAGWMDCATGQVFGKTASDYTTDAIEQKYTNIETVSKQSLQIFTAQQFYKFLSERQIQIDNSLQILEQIYLGADEAFGLAHSENGTHLFGMEPVLQLSTAFHNAITIESNEVFLPVTIDRIHLHGHMEEGATIRTITNPGSSAIPAKQDFLVTAPDGHFLFEVNGVHLERRGLTALQSTEDWLYEVDWELVERSASASETNQPGNWLILADPNGYGAALSAQLEKKGQSSRLVYLNDTTLLDENWFRQQVALIDGNLQGIIYLWGLGPNNRLQLDLADIERSHELLRLSVVQILRGIAAENLSQSPHLWFITRGAQPPIVLKRTSSLEQAALWGLGRVIAEESPDLWGGLIDLDPALTVEKAAELLSQEILDPQETQLAYYEDQRMALRLQPRARQEKPTEIIRLRSDASYLITGGLGGIGLEVAGWLIQHGARRLILMGRTPLPPRSEWAYFSQDDPIGRKIQAVQAMEAMGASIHIASVDITDEERVRYWKKQYQQEGWPPIRGIVHAAGLLRSGLVDQAEKADWNLVLDPKVRGSWLLHNLFQELDFFILCSSISSVLGPTGQGSYAMANSFLDALAHFRHAAGLPAISINWGPWEGVGMTADSRVQITLDAWENQGIATIPPDQGMAIFGRLFSINDTPQIMAFPVDWAKLQRSHLTANWKNLLSTKLAAPEVEENALISFRNTLLTQKPEQRLRNLETFLQQQIGLVLKLPPARIAPSKPLGSFGLDSLMAIELRSRLETVLDISLSATFVWTYPTLIQMCPYIADKMGIPLTEGEDAAQINAAHSVESTDGNTSLDETAVNLEEILAGIESLSDDNVQQAMKNENTGETENE